MQDSPTAAATKQVQGDIPRDLPIDNGQAYLFISRDQRLLTHALHKYPAKFFPELPRWLIQRFTTAGATVLDPFCGSGTTNIEALLSKRHSVGIDVDPFARLLCKTKTSVPDADTLIHAQEALLSRIALYDENAEVAPIAFPYRDHWFLPCILHELAYIRQGILELQTTPEIERIFLVCMSSIVRKVSNADNNCTRTVIRKKLQKKVNKGMALRAFGSKLENCVSRVIAFGKQVPAKYRAFFPEEMDAREIQYGKNYFDLAVTSPPYVNAVDYPRTHQLEMYWLGLVNGSLSNLKKQHVGTENVYAADYAELRHIGIPEADQALEQIYLQDRQRAAIAHRYLVDMEKNFAEVHRVLKKGARYAVVVGNNTIRQVNFENWRYFMKLATRTGFQIESHFQSQIINHFIKVPRKERINTEHILILRKQ